MFLCQKQIDRSTFRQGFQIPVEFHLMLKLILGGMPRHGETRNIKILIDGVEYVALLKNQGFDRNKYNAHAEVVQIRYSEGSDLVHLSNFEKWMPSARNGGTRVSWRE